VQAEQKVDKKDPELKKQHKNLGKAYKVSESSPVAINSLLVE